MSDTIMVALITGGCALIGTWLTCRSANQKIMSELEKHEAVQDERINELIKKVDKHNNLVERMYALEARLGIIKATKGKQEA